MAPAAPSVAPVVLITGASRGLGLSVAQILLRGSSVLRTPANVVTLSRSLPPALEQLTKEQQPSDRTGLIAVQGDVTKADDCRRAVEAAMERWGRLDALVLNAGTVEFARLADVTPDSFARQMACNVHSLVSVLHFAIPHLRASPTGCGRAVFVSSGAAVGSTTAWGAYNAGKAALNAIARTLANEEASIAVWAVRPGVVDTEMQRSIRDDARAAMRPDEYARFDAMHRDGSLLKPEQPAHVLAALALRGTRSHPAQPDAKAASDSNGAGAVGAFINWNAEELRDFQLPQ